jgi:antitoxin component of MazEF toxin-antitoxin module
MLTKRLTKIGDSTGLVIDKPILDLLGLARGDEVELKIENERLVVGPVEVSARAERVVRHRSRATPTVAACVRIPPPGRRSRSSRSTGLYREAWEGLEESNRQSGKDGT